jgi:hypothetical protein
VRAIRDRLSGDVAPLIKRGRVTEESVKFIGTREQSTENAEEVGLMRQRAMTLFLDLFEELRWGVRYTRRKQKDAYLIMPSLYTLRTKRRNAADEDDDVVEASEASAGNDGAADVSEIGLAHLD